MITFIINQSCLIAFNIANAYIDAYKFMRNKTVAHAVNGLLYIAFTTTIILLFRIRHWQVVMFYLIAFFNRQLSFDITLNLRRGLKWYYQSMADPPKAIMDRIERWLFGVDYDGEKIVVFYSIYYIYACILYLV